MPKKTPKSPARAATSRAPRPASTKVPKPFTPAATPIVRWAGGKAALVPTLASLLPDFTDIWSYCEPFAGGAALYLAIHDLLRAHDVGVDLRDANRGLINLYAQIATDPGGVYAGIQKHEGRSYSDLVTALNAYEHSGWSLTGMRGCDAAAVFLLVNRRCFNGLYRENRAGRFNVPAGSKSALRRSATSEEIYAASAALSDAMLTPEPFSFELLTSDADGRSFFYVDPPYDGTFSGYTKRPFGRAQQIELAAALHALNTAGAKWMLSTSDTPLIAELYKDFDVTPIDVQRSIAASGVARNKARELIIRNYTNTKKRSKR